MSTAIARPTRISGSSTMSSTTPSPHKPLMKLSVDHYHYRKSYQLKKANSSRRTLGEKRQVRSSILASLDRQISVLDNQKHEEESLSSINVPFDSIVSNQVLFQQSHRLSYQHEEEESTSPSPRIQNPAVKRLSARSSRILASLDKHLITEQEEPSEVSSEPATPKKASPTSQSSKRTSGSTQTTSETSRTSKSPKRSKKRTPSKKKSPKASPKTSSPKSSKSPKRSTTPKKKKRRSTSMDAKVHAQESASKIKRRSSSLSRPSTHSTISTSSIPLHLKEEEDDGSSKMASVLTTGNTESDVVIANLVPTTIISKRSMGTNDDDETTSTMTSGLSLKKTQKKKKQRGSMGSKRSYDSSLNTSSFDKSLNSTSIGMTIEEGEERSTSSHPNLQQQQQAAQEEEPVWGNITPGVAIGNLSPLPPPPVESPPESPAPEARTSGSSFDSEQQFEHFYAEAPPPVESPPESPAPEARTSGSSFDSEQEFEHFYAEPAKRSSVVSCGKEEQYDGELEETEAAMDEDEEINMDLMEASMSLSDIFGNLKDDNNVVIGNLAPSAPTPTKKDLTVRPKSHSPGPRKDYEKEEGEPSAARKPKGKKKRWSLRGQRTLDAHIQETSNRSNGSTRGRSPGARSKTPEKKRFSFRQQRTVDTSTEFDDVSARSGRTRSSKTPEKKRFSFRGQRTVDSSTEFDDVSTRSGRKTSRWSLRGQRTVDQDTQASDKRGSTRSFRTVDSWFGKGDKSQAPSQAPDEGSENSQDLASEQRLAAIFGAQGPGVVPASSILPQSISSNNNYNNNSTHHWESPKMRAPKPRVEVEQDQGPPRTPTADDYEDQDAKSRDRLREIFGADHHLALASPEQQVRKERRGSLGSVFSARSTRSARSADSKRKPQTPKGSLHSRFANRSTRSGDRSGRSRARSIDNNSSSASVFSEKSGRSRARSIGNNSSSASVFSEKSGRSGARSIESAIEEQDRQEQRRRGSIGSWMSSGSGSVKKNTKKKKERSRSPLKRAFSPKKSRSPPPKRVSEEEDPGRPLDDDILIVEGVLKRYDTEQCRTFEDHQEMAEAELISSITNTSPAELRRLKNKLAERLRSQLVASNDYEDDSVTNSDHLIEVYDQDDPSDVTSLTSLTSFTNFGGASVRSGSIGGVTYSKSSRTLDRPSNSALNYQHNYDDDDELVFVKSLPIHGGKYSGTVCPHSSQPHGNGRMVYRGSKGIYTGEWKQGQWNGKGKHIKANGDYYEGNFLDNLYHGEGVFSYKQSGRFFEGQYVMGERTKGTMRYADGSVYKGQFYHGRRHGRGSYTFKDGSRYKGDFYKDLMQGIGELRFRDGSSYVGEWKRGKHEGQGSMYSPDGMLCWAGMWKDGQQVLA